MYITCLDLEGVLVPEIWIAFAEETGIPELRLTTRDIYDYDILMNKRLSILAEHNLGLNCAGLPRLSFCPILSPSLLPR